MDAPLIQVGGKVDAAGVKAVADSIAKVFSEGRKAGMDQETVRAALQVLLSGSEVSNINITGCNLVGDKNQ